MGENEIMSMLGEIRSRILDINPNYPADAESVRMNLLDYIDENMNQYRGMSNEEVARKLVKK